ncbi:hypothetical protein PMAYCL1PPCAC_33471, partial [Pristionchus mayeri]
WGPRRTKFFICCQFVLPLTPHIYFIFAPVNWADGEYHELDDITGSLQIYRGITGVFYAFYAIFGMALNVVAIYRLHRLTLSSLSFYRQQRSLVIYTLTSTASHVIFALHQFAWSYSFILGDREILTIARSVRKYIYDLTTFADPIVLLCLSTQ